MGHQRYPRIPKTRPWRKVVALLDSESLDPASIAIGVLQAARNQLLAADEDPNLTYCYWLLTQITWQAKSPDFQSILDQLGIKVADDSGPLGLARGVAHHLTKRVALDSTPTFLGELAFQALNRVLVEHASAHTGSVFEPEFEDIRKSYASLATKHQFGRISRQFFGAFLSESLQYFLQKEVADHVGGHAMPTTRETEQLLSQVDRFAQETAFIVEEFAGGWYSKRNWQGDISLHDAQNFLSYAFHKLRADLALGVREK